MPSNRSVRLSDVATVAGVSLSTASKALSGNDRVSEETRARVRDAAVRLDFRPNALALSFASGRSRTIGVLTHRAASTFALPVITGAVLQLGALQHAALVFDGDIHAHRAMTDSIRTLRDRRIDGVLVIGDGYEHASPSVTHRFDVPVTYAFTSSDDVKDVVFLPDNAKAGSIATQHILDVGRRRVAHITASAGSLAAQRRMAGMIATLDSSDLSPAAAAMHGNWSRAWGRTAMSELLDSGIRVDAIFCGNDHIALGVLDICEARGIRVPDDLAIVGIDNWEGVVVDQDIRQLTTVDLELMSLGRLAAANVLGADRAPGERLTEPTLVRGPSS